MTRLQIHAQEASYESTRMKMANQRKKYFAKEINTVNYQTGQKVKENSSSPVVNTASLKAANGSNTLIFRNQKSIEPKSTSLKTNLDIKDVSLRDRIIHILAQRPHKKPELLLRLKKEGVLEKDRNNLTRVLGEVSVLKRDVHHLAENFWNEVKCNWKQYSKEDAKAVLEKIQYHCQNKKNPLTYENQSDNLPLKVRKYFCAFNLPSL
ncbi:RNA polymerase II elongation factor ELL2 [Nephila pilipes]|uniref:RNA polymerase II elongation factor ELL2 n=1 Tax=Nephila pilipes TaxID=299642 RepID=A0A8X6URU3_NEPPI|nr:RNA polymerase II elongation factor ELL2 [Nephila pilipes]